MKLVPSYQDLGIQKYDETLRCQVVVQDLVTVFPDSCLVFVEVVVD